MCTLCCVPKKFCFQYMENIAYALQFAMHASCHCCCHRCCFFRKCACVIAKYFCVVCAFRTESFINYISNVAAYGPSFTPKKKNRNYSTHAYIAMMKNNWRAGSLIACMCNDFQVCSLFFVCFDFSRCIHSVSEVPRMNFSILQSFEMYQKFSSGYLHRTCYFIGFWDSFPFACVLRLIVQFLLSLHPETRLQNPARHINKLWIYRRVEKQSKNNSNRRPNISYHQRLKDRRHLHYLVCIPNDQKSNVGERQHRVHPEHVLHFDNSQREWLLLWTKRQKDTASRKRNWYWKDFFLFFFLLLLLFNSLSLPCSITLCVDHVAMDRDSLGVCIVDCGALVKTFFILLQ